MNSICRAFTFYHDKLIMNTGNKLVEDNLRKEYLVIGYFDWFETSKVEIENFKDNSYTELFEYNSMLNNNNSEFQSFQNVFGFVDDASDSDEEFWTEDRDEILYFVMFLQLENYTKESFYDILSTLKSITAGKCHFMLYRTLDKNDFVVCLKCNKYKCALSIINNLLNELNQKGLSVTYSYTNLTVRHSVINNSSILDGLDETIDSICIKTILNNYNEEVLPIPEKINFFLGELASALYGEEEKYTKINNREIVGYEILGDTDCRFIARNVPINNLLNLYSLDGLLMRDDPNFNYCFVSSMTSLNKKYNYIEKIVNNKNNKRNIQTDYKTNEKIREIQSGLSHKHLSLITLLHQINNYILFSDYQTSGYELKPLAKPFSILLKLIIDNIEDINNESEIVDIDELYDYINNIYNNIQENIRTDIRFYGISDFSMMSYYSPTKLRAFYFYVIDKISDFYSKLCLSDNSVNYDFLIFFTHTTTTSVTQLWQHRIREDKIMMVKISEEEFYNVDDLVFQLAHEVAHFVGNEEIRNREERFRLILDFMIQQINKSIREIISENTSESASFIIEGMECLSLEKYCEYNLKKIDFQLDRYITSLVVNNRIERKEDFYYLKNLEKYLSGFLFDEECFVENLFNDYLNWIIREIEEKLYNLDNRSIKDIQNIMKDIKEYREKISKIIIDYKWLSIVSEVCDFIVVKDFMSETYADLSAVFLLGLGVEELFSIVFKRIPKAEREKALSKNLLFQRACVVTKVMSDLSEDYPEIDRSYSELFKKMPSSWSDLQLMLEYNEVIKVCQSIESNKEHPAYYTCFYVEKCLKSYFLCYKKEEKLREFLIELYKNICGYDIVSTVEFINEFVANKGNVEFEH